MNTGGAPRGFERERSNPIGTRITKQERGRSHICNQYVVRARRRDALREFLATQGVGTEVYYPVPFHLQECFRDLGYRSGDFPESERAAAETLALPIYPELTPGQQQYVVDRLAAFYR